MRVFLLGLGLGATLLTGCASIVKGGTQDMAIATNPEGARFSVRDNRNGRMVSEGVTPGNISLEKGAGYFKGADYTVTLNKEGYAAQKIDVESSASGWYLGGNFVFGGLIGWFFVDPATGAMWKLTPEGIDTQLAPMAAVAPPLAPMALPVSETTAAAPRKSAEEVPEYQPLTEKDLAQTAPEPVPQSRAVARSAYGDSSVGERLEALKQRRIRGEMSGEDYLAERNRIINGN